MNKKEVVKIIEILINKLYQADNFCDTHIKEIETEIFNIEKLISKNKFTRELIVLLNTCKLAKKDRRDSLKIAIISDLEKELKKIKEDIKLDNFENN